MTFLGMFAAVALSIQPEYAGIYSPGLGLADITNAVNQSLANYITNTQQGVSLTGIKLTPTSAFVGQGTDIDINNSGAVFGFDGYQGALRIKQIAGDPVIHMDRNNSGAPYWIEHDFNSLNTLYIPPNGMFGDVIVPDPVPKYPVGASGQMYVPQYLGSASGLADLPDPVGVASAMPVPSVAFTTFFMYGTNTSELVVTNIARMIATNTILSHMTNYGIPVVIHLDNGWQATNRDSAGKILPRSGQFPNGLKQVANEVHSFNVQFRPSVYFDAKIPTNNNTLHTGVNGSTTTQYPQQPDNNAGGLPIVDCSNPFTVEEDAEWFYTNNCDQIRVADAGVQFTRPGMLSQMRMMWDYAVQNPKGVNWRRLSNCGVSNCIAIEYLGTESAMSPFVIKLSNMQGSDVIAGGTNASDTILQQLRKYDLAQYSAFGQGTVPELSFNAQAFPIDTNAFKLFQSLSAAIPCAETMITDVITNGYATVYMTNESVWADFSAPFKTTASGRCVMTNGEFTAWSRMLDNGDVVVAVANKGTAAGTVNVPFGLLSGLSSNAVYTVFNDWAQTNFGVFSGSFTTPSIVNGSAELFHIALSKATLGGKPTAVTVGASPFTFVNNTTANLQCGLDDGVALFSISRNGTQTRGSLAGNSGEFILQPTNSIVITYPVTAPTFNTNSL